MTTMHTDQRGQVGYRRWRRFRSALICMQALDRTLAIDLAELSRISTVAAEAKLDYVHLVNSVAMLAEACQEAQAGLTELRKSLNESPNQHRRLSELLANHRIGRNAERHFLDTGGIQEYLNKISQALAARGDAYSRLYKLAVDPTVLGSAARVPVGVLAMRIGDVLPDGQTDGDGPDVAYGLACLAGPWALAACVVVATAVLILVDEGEAGGEGDGGEVGDFPIPDPGGDSPA